MKKIIIFTLLFTPLNSFAAWINTSGTVVDIVTYGHTNTILVNLSSNGTVVGECSNNASFAISKDIDEEARSRMYSMLLAEKAANQQVTVSYNDDRGCEPWDATPKAFRKIVRLRNS